MKLGRMFMLALCDNFVYVYSILNKFYFNSMLLILLEAV